VLNVVIGVVLFLILSVAGIVVYQQVTESAALKKSEAEADLARENCLLNQKRLESEERLVEIEKGPAAAAKKRAEDFKYKCN
jgi:uncharacterized membrane protein